MTSFNVGDDTVLIDELNEFDVISQDLQYWETDEKYICYGSIGYIDLEKIQDYDIEELGKKFGDWDARMCRFEIIVPKLNIHRPLKARYIINAEGKDGSDTSVYIKKLQAGEFKNDELFPCLGNPRETFPKIKSPKSKWVGTYDEFEKTRIWLQRLEPSPLDKSEFFLSYRCILEKLRIAKLPEIQCYASNCYIDGVMQISVYRNKKYSLGQALQELIKRKIAKREKPPSYEESFEKLKLKD